MNMILKDGTTIPIVYGSYTGAVILIVENRQALMDTWAQLTPVHFYLSETLTGDIPTDAEYALAGKILLGEEV